MIGLCMGRIRIRGATSMQLRITVTRTSDFNFKVVTAIADGTECDEPVVDVLVAIHQYLTAIDRALRG